MWVRAELAEREKMLGALRTTAGVDFVGADTEHDDVAMQVGGACVCGCGCVRVCEGVHYKSLGPIRPM